MSESKATKGSNQEVQRRPTTKLGRVAIWSNGKFYWITISPRRYRDEKTGEWKDAPSYRPADLPSLMCDLEQAIQYLYDHPLGVQDSDTEENAEVPF